MYRLRKRLAWTPAHAGFVRRTSHAWPEWYGFGKADVQALVALAEEGRRREWWQQVDLPDAYRTYIGMEQAAQEISEYQANVVPGLLQTISYARLAASIGDTGADAVDVERIEQATEVRLRRQGILQRDPPPRLNVVIDEAVLARGAHVDKAIRREQLDYLRTATAWPNVTVQVIGFEYGLYAGTNSAFILLEMGHGLSDLYYAEGPVDALALGPTPTPSSVTAGSGTNCARGRSTGSRAGILSIVISLRCPEAARPWCE